jgi:hypothetical protein
MTYIFTTTPVIIIIAFFMGDWTIQQNMEYENTYQHVCFAPVALVIGLTELYLLNVIGWIMVLLSWILYRTLDRMYRWNPYDLDN